MPRFAAITPSAWIVAGLLALAACRPSGAVVSAPRVVDEAATLQREQLELTCEGPARRPSCELAVRHTIEPRTHAPLDLDVVSDHVPRPTLEAAGLEISARATTISDAHQIDAVSAPRELEVTRYRIEAPPGSTTIELRTTLGPRDMDGFFAPAALARHHALTGLWGLRACAYEREGCELSLEYLPARPRDRSDTYVSERSVALPDGWTLDPHERAPNTFVIHSPRAIFAPGGPLLGVGLRSFDDSIVAARLGWEVFAPSYVAHAAVVELDGDRSVTLALTSEIMSPPILVLPSLGLGVGVPVELAPRPRVGARVQLSVHMPYLGLVVTLDAFAAGTERVRPSMFLQFTL